MSEAAEALFHGMWVNAQGWDGSVRMRPLTDLL